MKSVPEVVLGYPDRLIPVDAAVVGQGTFLQLPVA